MPDAREVDILRLGAKGEGVADVGGGKLYLPGALPGERVRLSADWADHQPAEAIVRPSPDRIAPVCRHFGTCGGCQLQHLAQEAYLAWKRQLVVDAFAARGLDATPQPVRAIPPGTRRRAVLTARRAPASTILGYHAGRSAEIIPIAMCPVLVPEIVRALARLAALASPLTGGNREARVTVTAASNGLDVALAGSDATPAPAQIAAVGARMGWGNIVRLSLDGQPVFIGAPPVLTFGSAQVVPPPGAFIQASADAEAAIVEIVTAAVGKAKHVADLFCGIGTLTFHLARRARVLAIDSDTASIAALQAGARGASGLKPIEARRRDLFGDPLSPLELNAFDAVVFDPPRAGAAAQAGALARSKVKTIVAVSCNPATLARDVRALIDGGYRLEALTPIDQFIFSAHVEAVAVLRR